MNDPGHHQEEDMEKCPICGRLNPPQAVVCWACLVDLKVKGGALKSIKSDRNVLMEVQIDSPAANEGWVRRLFSSIPKSRKNILKLGFGLGIINLWAATQFTIDRTTPGVRAFVLPFLVFSVLTLIESDGWKVAIICGIGLAGFVGGGYLIPILSTGTIIVNAIRLSFQHGQTKYSIPHIVLTTVMALFLPSIYHHRSTEFIQTVESPVSLPKMDVSVKFQFLPSKARADRQKGKGSFWNVDVALETSLTNYMGAKIKTLQIIDDKTVVQSLILSTGAATNCEIFFPENSPGGVLHFATDLPYVHPLSKRKNISVVLSYVVYERMLPRVFKGLLQGQSYLDGALAALDYASAVSALSRASKDPNRPKTVLDLEFLEEGYDRETVDYVRFLQLLYEHSLEVLPMTENGHTYFVKPHEGTMRVDFVVIQRRLVGFRYADELLRSIGIR